MINSLVLFPKLMLESLLRLNRGIAVANSLYIHNSNIVHTWLDLWMSNAQIGINTSVVCVHLFHRPAVK
jgi:hypothetical protein